jgi:hypothetical protein
MSDFGDFIRVDRDTKKLLEERQKELEEKIKVEQKNDDEKQTKKSRTSTDEEYKKMVSDPQTLIKIQKLLFLKKPDIYALGFIIWLSLKCYEQGDYKIKLSSYEITKISMFNGNYIFHFRKKLGITDYVEMKTYNKRKTTFDLSKMLEQIKLLDQFLALVKL